MKDFNLGKRVEAPHAIDLPLDLAVALLTDSQGRIDIAVPVRGNLEDPKFAYGEVIWQAFVTLIKKTVTAPFRALAGVFGGNGETLSGIRFEPGSARLLPPEQGKLAKVAEGLKDRQQLQVTVQGRFDEQLDGVALRERRVRRALAAQRGITLAPGEEPAVVHIDNAKTQNALEALLEARLGPDAVTKLAAQRQSAGSTAERVNPVLALFGNASPDTAFYEALFEQLVQSEPLAKEDLEALARDRSQTIVGMLTDFGVAAGRIASAKPSQAESSDPEGVESTMALEALETPGAGKLQ